MAEVRERERIRELLCADRGWSVYALGDLEPAGFAKSRWFTPDLTLVYRDYGTCILFSMGEGSVEEALEWVSWPLHLQVRPPTLALLERVVRMERRMEMWRMVWGGERTGWVETGSARRLGAGDTGALERLYGDGEESGEGPDFFFPAMVEAGVFYGVYEGEALVAAAGTHLYAPGEGVAAMGNVYTRRDRRGRGLGRIVTCAVLGELAGLETVGLNVRVENAAAIRVYESLGFVKHCTFYEARASGLREG
jgi:ribosomal protein S18 acetylase RimI-like enzyme